MTLNPGDEDRRHGDYLDLGENTGVSLGEAVELDGAGSYAALSEGGSAFGVKYQEGETGNANDTIKTRGVVVARVTSAVTEGDHLGSPDEVNGEPAGAFGNAIDEQLVHALEDATQDYDDTTDYHALVHIR